MSETQRNMCSVYGNDAERMCEKCCTKFRFGDFNINDAPQSGRLNEIVSCDNNTIVYDNPSQTLRKIFTALHFSHISVENYLQQVGYVSASLFG